MRNSTILIGLFITAVSCVSAPVENIEIRHEIRITNKGSRSEGEWGIILINERELPSYFLQVIAGNTQYEFVTREFLWSKGGYWSTGTVPTAPQHNGTISQKELSIGWYESDSDNRKKRTPDFWIWVFGKTDKDEDFSYWMNPMKIESFLDSIPLIQNEQETTGNLPAVSYRSQNCLYHN